MDSAPDALQRYINRIENLEEEIRALQADRAEIYKEAKDSGFDPKIMRKIVSERRKTAAARAEEEALLDTYRHALGMLTDTPLGTAALKAAKDHGRAAPRAAGNTGQAALDAQPVASARPATNPASPDPTPLEEAVARTLVYVAGPTHCVDCAAEVAAHEAMVRDDVSPLCRRCFDLRDADARKYPALMAAAHESQPPDLPPFLDRRGAA